MDSSKSTINSKEEMNGSVNGQPVGLVGKLVLLEELDQRDREKSRLTVPDAHGTPQPQPQPQPQQPRPVTSKRNDPDTASKAIGKTPEGRHPSLDMSESNNSLMGIIGKRLILAQEFPNAVTCPLDSASANTREASVLQLSVTNQNHRNSIGVSTARNPKKPEQPPRQDDVHTQQDQQVLIGALAVGGVGTGEEQDGSSGTSIPDLEQQDLVRDNHHDNHNAGLVEAETVDDLEQPKAIAIPTIDSTNTRHSITQKYQLRFAAVAPTTTRDTAAAPAIETALKVVFGRDYFQHVEETGKGNDDNLAEFLLETRQRAFDWIVNQDPMQLEYDSPNLVQRFVLVLFYYQTTRHQPWKECNPPEATQESAMSGFCYESHQSSGKLVTTIWGDQWLSASHECHWAGISCETVQSVDKTVVELYLYSNDLNGPLPREITRLSLLRNLRLHNNMLTGALPTKLFSKKAGFALETLVLYQNRFSGTIPIEWVASLLEGNGKLTILDLNMNTLTGSIPSELGLLPLKRLILTSNTLTGSIPHELLNLTSLERLFLGENDLTGTLPSEIGQLTNLEYLYLNYNNISGSLPSEIGLLSQLVELSLSNTNMRGAIPEEIHSGLANLGALSLDGCNFTGTISPSLGLLTDLKKLHVSNNHFHGTIPSEIEALTLLRELQVNGNDLSGTVPVSFCTTRYAGEIGSKVVADCLPNTETGIPAIQCPSDCCTSCCDDTGVCLAN
ncbi:receptor-like protein kinase precursor [Seminavis robusta]|uniref:Receptor-like protein kinase n=1 Tax=Seminavis robusta TaxID=568900 RepID=A0A9N8H0W5_9STRA|nr:receptor-like protein kinase precursor [Seminavis robusta]|eukprot:Sro7_g005860.1 receptor-like protein kinase precursor (729) ;mRNA; r:62785-65241